jgi:DNA-binding CsgD family transcriptional regulator/tetratricopeptide (TPR) repeat protein
LLPVAVAGATADHPTLFALATKFIEDVARACPLVLCIEDAQYADPDSLELLLHVAGHAPTTRLLLLVTFRSDELTRQHPLTRLMRTLVRETRVERIMLDLLGEAAVGAIVAAHAGATGTGLEQAVADLLDRSGGNPFVLTALLHTQDDAPRPTTVIDAFSASFERLDANTLELLAAAAVVGQHVPLALWASVAEVPSECYKTAIEAGVAAGWLESEPAHTTISFRHELIREALYERMPLPQLRTWHRRAGEALAAAERLDTHAAAWHFGHAGDPRAAEWLVRGGEDALSRMAPRTAIEHFSRAIALDSQLPVARQIVVYRARANAYAAINAFDRARVDHVRVLELARSSGDQPAEWQALFDLGTLWLARDVYAAGSSLELALELARATGDRERLARSLNAVGSWHVRIGQAAEAQRHYREGLATYRALDDRHGVEHTLDLLAAVERVRAAPAAGDAAGITAELPAVYSDTADSLPLLLGAYVHGITTLAGSYVESERDGEMALQLARETGWRSGEVFALLQLGQCVAAQGNYARAWELLGQAESLAQEMRHEPWLALIAWVWGTVHLDLLAVPAARVFLERSLELARGTDLAPLEGVVTALLELISVEVDATARTSQPDTARATNTIGAAKLVEDVILAECRLAHADAESCISILDDIRSSPWQEERVVPRLALLRGEALALARRVDDAAVELQAAVQAATAVGARPLLWRAHTALGTQYRAQRRDADAEREFEAARAVVAELASGVPDAEARAAFLQGALSRLPVRGIEPAPEAAPDVFTALSPRERDVLRLVAEGLTDAEVAERLYLSPRTVGRHLTSVYNKLGVNTRTAATRLALAHRLI